MALCLSKRYGFFSGSLIANNWKGGVMAVQFNFSPAITLSAVAFSPLIGYHYFTGLD